MKHFIRISLCMLFVFIFTSKNLNAQSPLGYGDSYFGVAAGGEYKTLNDGDFFVGTLEFNAYSSSTLIEYNTTIEYGENYFSFEPVSVIGVIAMCMFIDGQGSATPDMLTFFGLLGTSSAKISIFLFKGWVELVPKWNLLKLTKLYDNKLYFNGNIGGELKIYLTDGLYISPYWEYNFGYKYISKAKSNYEFHNENANHDKSPFRGQNFGLYLGYYF